MNVGERQQKARELIRYGEQLAGGASPLHVAQQAVVSACCLLLDRATRPEVHDLAARLAQELLTYPMKGGEADAEVLTGAVRSRSGRGQSDR